MRPTRRFLPARFLLPLVILTVLACQAPAPDEPALEASSGTLVGRVLAATGEPSVRADVHLVRAADGEPVESVRVAGDGAFELPLPGGEEMLQLEVTAVDHQPLSLPLPPGAVLEPFELTLAVNEFKEPLEKVEIVGSWNGFDRSEAEPMERRDDGTFVYVVEDAGDEVSYQLVGATRNGNMVNGPQADDWEYDGDGNYQSIVRAIDGRTEIVVDPDRLPAPGADAPARFAPASGLFARLHEVETAVAAAQLERYKSQAKGAELVAIFEPVRRTLHAALEDESPALKAFAALRLLEVPEEACDAGDRQAALEHLDADSPLWSLAGWAVSGLDPGSDGELLEALRDAHPDPTVRGFAWAAFVRDAKEADDEASWREHWSELEAYRDDVPSLGYLIDTLNPDRRVQLGKQVPEFEVALYEASPEGTDTVSSASLEGTYYLLDFWATWCAPCVAELPELHEAWEHYGGNGKLQILSLSFDEKPDDIAPFREEKFAMPWLHTFVEDGFGSELAESFEVVGIPEPILVDPEGRIIGTEKNLRGDDLMKTLAEHLGE